MNLIIHLIFIFLYYLNSRQFMPLVTFKKGLPQYLCKIGKLKFNFN